MKTVAILFTLFAKLLVLHMIISSFNILLLFSALIVHLNGIVFTLMEIRRNVKNVRIKITQYKAKVYVTVIFKKAYMINISNASIVLKYGLDINKTTINVIVVRAKYLI